MLYTDKAFSIWMGHAGEDTQVFVQDEPSIETAAFEHTQVLALARRTVVAPEAMAHSRRQAPACEAEGLAA